MMTWFGNLMDKNHNIFWTDPEPDFIDTDNEKEEIIWVSKSEIKRDANALKKIGVLLVELSPNQLDKMPLDPELHHAILLAQKIKNEGYRRQIQWIGKLLRQRDTTPIEYALNHLKNRNQHHRILLQKLARLQNNLIETGDTAAILKLYPNADRQKLRALARVAKKEKASLNNAKAGTQIMRYLKELSEHT